MLTAFCRRNAAAQPVEAVHRDSSKPSYSSARRRSGRGTRRCAGCSGRKHNSAAALRRRSRCQPTGARSGAVHLTPTGGATAAWGGRRPVVIVGPVQATGSKRVAGLRGPAKFAVLALPAAASAARRLSPFAAVAVCRERCQRNRTTPSVFAQSRNNWIGSSTSSAAGPAVADPAPRQDRSSNCGDARLRAPWFTKYLLVLSSVSASPGRSRCRRRRGPRHEIYGQASRLRCRHRRPRRGVRRASELATRCAVRQPLAR